MNPFKDPLLEIRADGLVAVLTFKTGETSTLTKKFAHEQLTLIAASTKKKPIVCTTDRSVVAVYRAAVDFGQFTDERGLTLDYSGKQFADSRGDLSARIGIGATCGLVNCLTAVPGSMTARRRTPHVIHFRFSTLMRLRKRSSPWSIGGPRQETSSRGRFGSRASPTSPSTTSISGLTRTRGIRWTRDDSGTTTAGGGSCGCAVKPADNDERDFDSLQELRAHSRAQPAASPRGRAQVREG